MPNYLCLTLICLTITSAAYAQPSIQVGSTPPPVVLAAGNGGVLKNNKWDMWSSTESLQHKIHVVFYVAPSAKSLNQHVVGELKAKAYPMEKLQTLVIVNTASSWWPDAILDGKIKSNQTENPRATYLKDSHRTVLKAWGLQDDSNDIFVFNAQGQTLFAGYGALQKEQKNTFFEVIENALQSPQ